MTRKVRIALIQADFRSNRVDENLKKFTGLIRSAVLQYAPDFVVLPEFFTTGFGCIQEVSSVAEVISGSTINHLQEVAKKNKIAIAGSIPEKHYNSVTNTGFLLNRQGKIQGTYQKLHLFPLMNEPDFVTPGTKIDVIPLDSPEMVVGMIICYDLRFPELIRRLVEKGAELLVVLAEWPRSRVQQWLTLLQARAIENQIFVVGCNRTGTDELNIQYPGASIVVDPLGKILTPILEEEGIIMAEIDLDLIYHIRSRISYLEERHPLIR